MMRRDVSEEEWEKILKDIDRILANPEEANRRVDEGVEAWLRRRRSYIRSSRYMKGGL